jgi:hypothetical protein
MAKLGILFDIDALGGGLYGYAAYKVLFSAIDSRQLAGCTLYDGDTNATLRGGARQYCIALDSSNPRVLDLAKRVIAESKEPGLLSAAARFMTDATVRSEPLVLATSINSSGELVGCKTGWVTSAHKESVEKWRTTAQKQEAPIASPKSKWWHFWK